MGFWPTLPNQILPELLNILVRSFCFSTKCFSQPSPISYAPGPCIIFFYLESFWRKQTASNGSLSLVSITSFLSFSLASWNCLGNSVSSSLSAHLLLDASLDRFRLFRNLKNLGGQRSLAVIVTLGLMVPSAKTVARDISTTDVGPKSSSRYLFVDRDLCNFKSWRIIW